MSDAFIRVAPDSTGKRMQTFENTISSEDVHAEAVVLVDTEGNALTSESFTPVSVYKNFGASFTGVIANAPGATVLSLTCFNINPTKKAFAQLFNRITVPATGVVPDYMFYVPPLTQIVIDEGFFTRYPFVFDVGLAVGLSGTQNSFINATSAAELTTIINYRL